MPATRVPRRRSAVPQPRTCHRSSACVRTLQPTVRAIHARLSRRGLGEREGDERLRIGHPFSEPESSTSEQGGCRTTVVLATDLRANRLTVGKMNVPYFWYANNLRMPCDK